MPTDLDKKILVERVCTIFVQVRAILASEETQLRMTLKMTIPVRKDIYVLAGVK